MQVTINGGRISTFAQGVVLRLAAEDPTGIMGYLVTESSTPPAAQSGGWTQVSLTHSLSVELPFTLSAGDGNKSVRAFFLTTQGTVLGPAEGQIRLAAAWPMDDIHVIAMRPDGKELYAWGVNTRLVAIVDLTSEDYPVVAAIPLPGVHSVPQPYIVFSPDSRYAFLTDNLQTIYEPQDHRTWAELNHVVIIDTRSRKIDGFMVPPEGFSLLGPLAVSPDGTTLYAGVVEWARQTSHIAVADLTSRRFLTRTRVPGLLGLRLAPDGRKLLATTGQSFFETVENALRAYDPVSLSMTAMVGVGLAPNHVVVTPDSRKAYVPNFGSNTVSVVDLARMEVTATIPVGPNPNDAAVTPDGKKVYVGNTGLAALTTGYQFGDSVSVIDTLRDQVIRTIHLYRPEPDSIAIDPQGSRVFVSDGGSGGIHPSEIHLIDAQRDVAVRQIVLRGSASLVLTSLTVTPDGRRMFVILEGCEAVEALSLPDGAPTAALRLFPRGLEVSADGRRLYVYSPQYPPGGSGRLFILDSTSLDIIDSIDLGRISSIRLGEHLSYKIRLNAKEDTAYLPATDREEILVVDLKAKKLTARIPLKPSQDAVQTRANGIALTPDGAQLFATSCTTRSVMAIDLKTSQVTDTIRVGNCPSAVRMSSDGKRVFVMHQHDTTLMTILDAQSHRILRVVPFGVGIAAVEDFILTPDDRRAYISCYDGNMVMLVDLETEDPGRQIVTFFATGVDPMGIAATADRKTVYCAHLTSDNVAVIDTAANRLSAQLKPRFTPPRPLVKPSSIVNAASGLSGPIAPGEIVSVFGFAPAVPTAKGEFDASGVLLNRVAATRILFDGLPAPLLYVSAGQWNAVVPYSTAGLSRGTLEIEFAGDRSSPLEYAVAPAAPGIFSASGDGCGRGAFLNEDGTLNSAQHPAVAGSVITLFATGAGQTAPAGVDGKMSSPPLPKPVLPVSVTVENRSAEILYAGAAPGLVAGALQVNLRVPEQTSPGAVPVILRIGEAVSQTCVTVAVTEK